MGTGHLFTRRELYERVWAEPISALAKTLQVSDVWLAKTCRLSNDRAGAPRTIRVHLNVPSFSL